jgi:hypothetical protein
MRSITLLSLLASAAALYDASDAVVQVNGE